jgi:hypothetical protein
MKKSLTHFLLFCTFACFPFFISAQNVGINTLTPLGKLHIKGSEDVTQLIIDADTIQGSMHPLLKFRNSAGTDLLWLHADDTTNVFLGLKAGSSNIVGPQGVNNTFIGSHAGFANTNGRDNTAIGTNAMPANTKGSLNTAIGTNALFTQSFGPGGAWYQTNNVAVGYEALYSNQPTSGSSGVNNTAIGSSALRSNTTASQNTATGTYALYLNTIGTNNTATGYGALNSNTTAGENTAIGTRALLTQSYSNSGTAWISANVAIGFEALYANQPSMASNGKYNTAVGHSALHNNTIGHRNTAFGFESLYSNISGDVNTAIGIQALYSNTIGEFNVAIGNIALQANSTGTGNTATGGSCLTLNSTGSYNTASGNGALDVLVGGTGNSAFGAHSGTAIGAPNVSNTISIGNDGYANGASNQAYIGNLSTVWTGGQTTWFTYASDARVKDNVTEDVKGLDFIERLRPVTYNLDINAMRVITGNKETEDYPGKYDVEKIKQSGFIAQEVILAAKVSGYSFSGVTVPANEHELYTMSYAQFVVPLVKAVQEQQAIIENLQAQVNGLQAEVTRQTAEQLHLQSQQEQIDALLMRVEALENK